MLSFYVNLTEEVEYLWELLKVTQSVVLFAYIQYKNSINIIITIFILE